MESAKDWWKHSLSPEFGIRRLAGDRRSCMSPKLPNKAGTAGQGPETSAGSQEGRGIEAEPLQFVMG